MYSKLIIQGKIETVTGLHIGTGNAYSAIGAADSPVIRDIKEHLPMIPGSSLKGKLRTLLAKKYCSEAKSPNEDNEEIKNLFGSMICLFPKNASKISEKWEFTVQLRLNLKTQLTDSVQWRILDRSKE